MLKLFCILIFLSLGACTQKQPYSPMLWEITGKNLTKPSYLFGTFHTKDPEFNTFPPSVLSHLKKSQRLYTEIAMTKNTQKEILTLSQYSQPTPLKNRLHPRTIKLLRHYLIDNHLPYTLKSLAPFKIWSIALIIENQEKEIPENTSLFMDEHLVAFAKKVKIKSVGLESPIEQLHYFNILTKAQQEQFLLATLKKEAEPNYTRALKTWYKKGEAEGFSLLQNLYRSKHPKQQKLDTFLMKGLLLKRNDRFTRRIDILLQNNSQLSYFFAIGAGHLSDKKGLISRLIQLGYTLKKID